MAPEKRKHVAESENVTEVDDLFKEFDINLKKPLDDEENDSDSSESSSVYSELEEEDGSSTDSTENSEDEQEDDKDDNENLSLSSKSPEESEDEREGNIKKKKSVRPKTKMNPNKEKIMETIKQTENKTTSLGPVASVDEYDFDSSDEEDIRNTVGNIPMEWYNELTHIGYDWDGNKIMKPITKDELDKFLTKMEDPNYWRTVQDKMTGQDVILADEDVDIIQRIQSGIYPDSSYNPYKPWVDIYSHEVEIHPMTNQPEHKRSFLPSLRERQLVTKILQKIRRAQKQSKSTKPVKKPNHFYMIWTDDEKNDISKRMLNHIPAPKMRLPGHEESYNPPPEYLFDKEEKEKWLSTEPDDRKREFMPQKYSCLRHVPAYTDFIKERFERCLDLYLNPRQRKTRSYIDPEDLIPKLPKPKDLQPFPTTLSLMYKGHEGAVRCITVDHSGQYLASGSDDNTIKFWEVSTRRCLRTMKVSGSVQSIAWCPNANACLVAAAVNNLVLIINPGFADNLIVSNTDSAISAPLPADATSKSSIEWKTVSEEDWDKGIRFILDHPKEVKQVTWHAKGDYFATVLPNGGSASVQVHQLIKRQSQQPFSKPKGLVQCVMFHPTRPLLLVATQKTIRMYNLVKQELDKKLITNCNWISSMAMHPGGDNIITGSHDPRLCWFDLELSTKPYKALRHQKESIRQVAFHKRYPLFASAADDCTVVVCHGKVYNDLMQNPLIVPVKVLKGHKKTHDLGVLDCQFHPNAPWIFTAGADGNICLFT
uniref:Ribosome biogenesis protein BOP1 homolog n=1 Tax=Strigamia maritima TaxID=126957 RepID=T1J4W3_STRMM